MNTILGIAIHKLTCLLLICKRKIKSQLFSNVICCDCFERDSDIQMKVLDINFFMLKLWYVQEPLVELANPSDTDIDIPANFD
jgi:hypothetical protein